MKISQKGIDLIKSFEKCKLSAYKDGKGVWTIGWGNTFYETGRPVQPGDVITQERADDLFLVILSQFEKDVTSLVKSCVSQPMFDALVSFAYNCGSDIDADTVAEGLGDSTLLKLVNINPKNPQIYLYTYADDRIAATGSCEFMKWVSKGSKNELGLRRRRQAECDLYRTGI